MARGRWDPSDCRGIVPVHLTDAGRSAHRILPLEWSFRRQIRRDNLIGFALEHEALMAREFAVKYIGEKWNFIAEGYRSDHRARFESPAYVVVKAADEFTDKTTALNGMWRMDFTHFKVIGWGWSNLSTILDDYSRYITA